MKSLCEGIFDLSDTNIEIDKIEEKVQSYGGDTWDYVAADVNNLVGEYNISVLKTLVANHLQQLSQSLETLQEQSGEILKISPYDSKARSVNEFTKSLLIASDSFKPQPIDNSYYNAIKSLVEFYNGIPKHVIQLVKKFGDHLSVGVRAFPSTHTRKPSKYRSMKNALTHFYIIMEDPQILDNDSKLMEEWNELSTDLKEYAQRFKSKHLKTIESDDLSFYLIAK